MTQIVDAIFENGIIIPLTPLSLVEHTRLKIIITDSEDPVLKTQGIMKGIKQELIADVALNPEYSFMEA